MNRECTSRRSKQSDFDYEVLADRILHDQDILTGTPRGTMQDLYIRPAGILLAVGAFRSKPSSSTNSYGPYRDMKCISAVSPSSRELSPYVPSYREAAPCNLPALI